MSAAIPFMSCSYLGFRHDAESLARWSDMTSGVPSALRESRRAREAAQHLATLQGCERGCLMPSTLHIFQDLFRLWPKSVYICFDEGIYPITRWGIERAVAEGYRAVPFRSHDPADLGRILRENSPRPAVVVSDGFCPDRGKFSPLSEYLAAARTVRGHLVIDDTQALGIFGTKAGAGTPFGSGGGGSLRWFELHGEDVVVASSLAKGFGAPAAVLCGSRRMIELFEERSDCRKHCSPVSSAHAAAVLHALECNESEGERIRYGLAILIRQFRQGIRAAGISCAGAPFPIQGLRLRPEIPVQRLLRGIERAGIKPVLLQPSGTKGKQITFVINARHTAADIQAAVSAVIGSLREMTPSISV